MCATLAYSNKSAGPVLPIFTRQPATHIPFTGSSRMSKKSLSGRSKSLTCQIIQTIQDFRLWAKGACKAMQYSFQTLPLSGVFVVHFQEWTFDPQIHHFERYCRKKNSSCLQSNQSSLQNCRADTNKCGKRRSLHVFFYEIENCNVFQGVLTELLKMKTAFLVGNLAE